MSARQVPDVNADLRLYADSFQNLRRPPQIGSNEVQYSLPTYENRYSESVAADVKPQMHADSFYGDARTNAAFGEFLTAYTYQTFSGGEARFAVDETADAYDIASATDQYDGDYFRMTVGAKISGQRGSDTVEEEGLLLDGDLTIEVRSRMTALFFDHRMITQLKNDMWYERINERDLKGLKAGFQCVDPVRAAYIPSAANYDISDRRDNDGEGDFSTYQDEKPGEPMSLNESVECRIVNGKRECD